jgi:hypothetical protein
MRREAVPDRPPTLRVAAEALRLRGWCAARLLRGSRDGAPPACGEAWRLFLAQERCAALLADSLRRDPPSEPIGPDASRALAGQARAELVRILSARAQLRTVAAIAGEEGWRVVVLKGSADIASGIDVLAMDVDVWVEPGVEPLLARRLDEAGFRPQRSDGHFHLAPRTMPGALQVEIHRAVTGFPRPDELPVERATPLPALPPLLRLAPEDHAWTILCQAVDKHPDRRTRIRDLFLLREALTACPPAGLERLEERVRHSRDEGVLRRMLDGALGEGAPAPDERLYLFLARTRDLSGGPLSDRLLHRARNVAAAGPVGEWRRMGRLHDYERGRSPLRVAGRFALHLATCALASALTAGLPRLRREWAARGRSHPAGAPAAVGP